MVHFFKRYIEPLQLAGDNDTVIAAKLNALTVTLPGGRSHWTGIQIKEALGAKASSIHRKKLEDICQGVLTGLDAIPKSVRDAWKASYGTDLVDDEYLLIVKDEVAALSAAQGDVDGAAVAPTLARGASVPPLAAIAGDAEATIAAAVMATHAIAAAAAVADEAANAPTVQLGAHTVAPSQGNVDAAASVPGIIKGAALVTAIAAEASAAVNTPTATQAGSFQPLEGPGSFSHQLA